jgi:hypothetical protein
VTPDEWAAVLLGGFVVSLLASYVWWRIRREVNKR